MVFMGTCLVIDADGFLGNNIVRVLLENNMKVKACVRNTRRIAPFMDVLGSGNFHLAKFNTHNRNFIRSAMAPVMSAGVITANMH